MTAIATPRTTNVRVQEIFTDVVGALRAIIVKHDVTWEEYRAATSWLTTAGTQPFEIPLMLDVFLSTAVDDVNCPANGGTESNVEGPFYVPDAPMLELPYVLPKRDDEPGETLIFSGTVTATDGSPLAGALIDVWQDNGAGEYSHFHPGVPEYNLRGRLHADTDGRFQFETVVPVSYEIPKAGATGQLLEALGMRADRPSHIHLKLSHEQARPLTTQIYFANDPLLDFDVVGAVKPELVTALLREELDDGRSVATCSYDFVLPPA